MKISKKIANIIKLLFDDWQNKAISILIAILMFVAFHFNKIESITTEKEFKIILNDQIALGKIPDFSKVKITIKVNKDDLKYLDLNKIILFIEASKIKIPGKYKLPIKIKNLNSIHIAEYKLSKTNVLLNLDNKISKLVKIEPKFKLIEKDGKGEYFIAKYNILPEHLLVYGPEQELKKINTIQTNIKEFDTRTLFVSDYLEVVPPNPLVVFEKSHVVINIYLNKKYSNTTIKSPNLIFNNLKNGLEIKDKEKIINPENKIFVKIKTRLSEKQIKNHINNQNISLAFDLSDIKTPGIYNIPTNIILKENINETEIYDYEPKKIKIEIIESPEIKP
ncbi:YbbR-like domain-containing protein [Borreliella lusitaniae]|uniref:YbbR-like domain-containing protein n=1 Tax=Borreliella lusitaniae TaxID=100177 RepID=A0ABZ0CGE3_9SPIR|nr:YbbR-like domain-containing protein [Borreliella lusitaniae]WNY66404.1 YbbR-like domain-containing protein [Borreliella lusitaniae]WNY68252.1 YbbR-like domain-containing protein [Borreliella lusitaniae]